MIVLGLLRNDSNSIARSLRQSQLYRVTEQKTSMGKFLSVYKTLSMALAFYLCLSEAVRATEASKEKNVNTVQINAVSEEIDKQPSWRSDPPQVNHSLGFIEIIPQWLSDDPVAPREVPLAPSTPPPATQPPVAEVEDAEVPSGVPAASSARVAEEPASAEQVMQAPQAVEDELTTVEVTELYDRAVTPTEEPYTGAGIDSLLSEPTGEQMEETPLILGLLREAEQALNNGNLLEPSHGNAYDRYQSVLILDKNNRKARAGLREILRRYSALVSDAAKNNRLRRADALLTQLSRFYPGNAEVKRQRQAVNKLRKKQEAPAVANAGKRVTSTEDIPLPTAPLDKRSDELLSLLSDIVVRLIESDESILIYARSDSEGRWIYSQMKRLSGGYRIRGDIRISKKPRISVLPPL